MALNSKLLTYFFVKTQNYKMQGGYTHKIFYERHFGKGCFIAEVVVIFKVFSAPDALLLARKTIVRGFTWLTILDKSSVPLRSFDK